MQTLIGVKQSIDTVVATKINYHSQTLLRHDEDLQRLSAESADMRHAFADRHATSEIIVSAIPKIVNLSSDEMARSIFSFIDLPAKFFDIYLRSTRFANTKLPEATTKSLIIKMISSELCEEVLIEAAKKRRSVKFTVQNIFNIADDSVIYVNKMQSTYIQHLAYLARTAKKRFGWKSVWVHAGNVCIKRSDQTPTETVSLISQLESLTQ